jgi:hypothetical protein
VHSLAVECREREKSGHQEKAKQRDITHELSSTKGGTSQDTKRRRDSEGVRRTHSLLTIGGGPSHNTKGMQESKGYSPPGERRRRRKSGQREKTREEGHSRTVERE